MDPHTILLADDDIHTRIILRTLLERHRFAIVEAETAEAALDHTQRKTFDLIILNYPMPDANGVTLARRLRNAENTRFVPILNLTSRVVPQLLQDAFIDGVDLSIPKPIDIHNIVRVIESLIKRSVPAAG